MMMELIEEGVGYFDWVNKWKEGGRKKGGARSVLCLPSSVEVLQN